LSPRFKPQSAEATAHNDCAAQVTAHEVLVALSLRLQSRYGAWAVLKRVPLVQECNAEISAGVEGSTIGKTFLLSGTCSCCPTAAWGSSNQTLSWKC